MKSPHHQKHDSGSNPLSSANPVSHTLSLRRRFHFAMESARPCLDAGRYLMLLRQHHAKGRQKRFAVPDLLANA